MTLITDFEMTGRDPIRCRVLRQGTKRCPCGNPKQRLQLALKDSIEERLEYFMTNSKRSWPNINFHLVKFIAMTNVVSQLCQNPSRRFSPVKARSKWDNWLLRKDADGRFMPTMFVFRERPNDECIIGAPLCRWAEFTSNGWTNKDCFFCHGSKSLSHIQMLRRPILYFWFGTVQDSIIIIWRYAIMGESIMYTFYVYSLTLHIGTSLWMYRVCVPCLLSTLQRWMTGYVNTLDKLWPSKKLALTIWESVWARRCIINSQKWLLEDWNLPIQLKYFRRRWFCCCGSSHGKRKPSIKWSDSSWWCWWRDSCSIWEGRFCIVWLCRGCLIHEGGFCMVWWWISGVRYCFGGWCFFDSPRYMCIGGDFSTGLFILGWWWLVI